ncbi:hypothetical protein [Streptomyces bottropensis]|uniref:hypothetical protein n=1 Tax=Streptomyces bottropensis TaxID=42235 RepID=UPI0036BF07FF
MKSGAAGAGGKQTGSKTNSSGSGLGSQKNSSGGRGGAGDGGKSPGSGAGSGGKGSPGSASGLGSKGGGAGGRGPSGGGKAPGQGAGGLSSGAKPPHSGAGPKNSKDSGSSGGGSGSGGAGKDSKKDSKSGSSGNSGSAGGRGSDGKPGKDGQPGKGTGASGKAGSDDSRNERPWRNRPAADKKDDKSTGDGSAKNAPADTKAAKTDAPKTAGAPGDTAKPVDLSKKPDATDKKPTQDPKQPGTPASPNSQPSPGKPLDVQPSRETGYRDGTRASRVIAHMGAYRDGYRDGYRDTQEAADRQRDRLDKAHDDRKQQCDTETKGADVSAKTSADHHPQPLPVQQVTATHVAFGGGPPRTRGEVRTLKQYERRLEEKADSMHRIADATKKLQAHAEDQAKEATQLLEQAKAIKGGEKVISVLSRLVDKATNQARLAGNLQQRAVRAAENTTVVLVNTQTRYGPIYKAVVDSPETKPAELRFYRDGGTSNG